LPDATPSPALLEQQRYQSAPVELPAVDAATVALLRLQLAAADHVSKERLALVQSMEEELHLLKGTRAREGEELSRQVSVLEEQLHNDLATRERKDEEHAAYITALEAQLRQERSEREQNVADALAKAQEVARESQKTTIEAQRRTWEAVYLAHNAGAMWDSALSLAQDELELVQANKEARFPIPNLGRGTNLVL
jgi:hypothetical protein